MIRKIYIALLLTSIFTYADNTNIDALYKKAKESILESNGQVEKIEKAKRLLKQIEAMDPNSKEVKLLKAKLLVKQAYIKNDEYRMEDIDDASTLAQEVLDDNPNNLDALLLLTSNYRLKGTKKDFEISKKLLNKAYNIDKTNIQVQLNLLDIFIKKKEKTPKL